MRYLAGSWNVGIIKTKMIIKANVRTRLQERMVTLIGQLNIIDNWVLRE